MGNMTPRASLGGKQTTASDSGEKKWKWRKNFNVTKLFSSNSNDSDHDGSKRQSDTFSLNLLTSIVIKKMIDESGDLNYDVVAGWRREQWQEICDEVNRQCDNDSQHLDDWREARSRFMRESAENHDACVHQTFATADPENDDDGLSPPALTQNDVMKLRLRTNSVGRVIQQHLGIEPSQLTLADLEKVGVVPDTTKSAQNFYISTGFDTRYGVKESEYTALSPEAREQVNQLRNLVWQFAHAFKCRGPPGSVERTFWTQGVVRKIVLLHIAKLWYEKDGETLLPEANDFLEKMTSL